MNDRIENKILSNLIFVEDYMRKVIPFIKDVYFDNVSEKTIFQEILDFVNRYDGLPSKSVLSIEVENRKDLSEDMFKECSTIINSLSEEKVDQTWLIDSTEKWCRRELYILH